MTRVPASPFARYWSLDPEVVFVNHGSFGACPKSVQEAQSRLRQRLEREPVQFFIHELEAELDAARRVAGDLVGCNPRDLVFVPNATTGVSTVLANLELRPADELLITNHAYPACRNAARYFAERAGARVREVPLPFSIEDPGLVTERVLSAAGERTRLVLLDHVTSPTALILPVAELVSELRSRGIDTLIDGAHAPGMVPLDLERLGATYYAANFHKWCCAPKGAGMLYVERDRQRNLRPLVLSLGASSQRQDRPRFLLEFDWTGTMDPSAVLCLSDALDFLRGLFGDLATLARKNHELVLAGRELLAEALGVGSAPPESMLGSMATLPLPRGPESTPVGPVPALQAVLYRDYGIEVPILDFAEERARYVRISAHAYNSLDQYRYVAQSLVDALSAE